MSFNLATRVLPETLRTIAFGAISGTYAGIGSSFEHPIRWFMMQNDTDADVLVSWDGINNHQFLPTGGYVIMDVASNKSTNGGVFVISQGTRFYVKQASGAAGSGSVYLSVFYGYSG